MHINAEYGKYVISLYTTDNCSTANYYKYINSSLEIKENNNAKQENTSYCLSFPNGRNHLGLRC